MLKTRDDIKKYALEICVPQLEIAAEHRLSKHTPEVMDAVGYVPTLLEELFRPFWGIAPLLRESEPVYMTVRGEKIEVGNWLREVLVSGTNPESEFSWDKDRDSIFSMFHFQNITEIAGLLVGMYFAREKTWELLTSDEKKQVADWIYDGCVYLCRRIAGNNHIWFPLLCLLVLKKFGFVYPETDRFTREGMEKLDSMYVGGGWYSDGDFGRIDYYEAWSMHAYPLLWCIIEDDSFDGYTEWRDRYVKRTGLFLRDYIKFFDRDGAFPPFGRSLAYRFAAVCVFPLAVLAGVDFPPALAKTVTVRDISYFKDNVRTRDGVLPPGFLYDAPAVVENYTSSGGAYWAAKSFLCLLIDESHPFWSGSEEPLPIERGAYISRPSEEKLNFDIAADLRSGVTVYNNFFQYYQHGCYCNPFNDMAGCYDKFAYNSRSGFALSARDNTSCDNMISLSTRDGSMRSHRWGFTDLGRADGFMVSEHIPFSNDPETLIHTWMKPLANGWHLRIHRVRLSREYSVTEGSFSVGLWDDYRLVRQDGNVYSVENRKLISRVSTAASADFKYICMKPQPGMHLLAPCAVYPAYTTNVLAKGEYWFASVFGIHDAGTEAAIPAISLDNGTVKLICGADKIEFILTEDI